MSHTEKGLKSVTVYDGKIMKVVRDEVLLEDGTHAFREILHHSGGAAALFVKDGKVALVKQFRYAYGKELYEIPAGKLEAGEEPGVAALRELEEETGYRAEQIFPLLKLYPSPGYTDEVIHIYLVTHASYVGQRLDSGEYLDCRFFDINEVLSLIEDESICDAKTVAAIYKYLAENK